MSKIKPCLWFATEAEEAANFYTSLLPDSRVDLVMRNPIESPAGPAGGVLLVEFTVAGQSFQALNAGSPMERTHAISFSVDCNDQAELDRLWDALLEGGKGKEVACGWLQDRYGMSWQIAPGALMNRYLSGPDTAAAGRVMAAMMQMVKIDIAALERAYHGA